MKASGIVALSSMELNSGLTAFADNQSDGSKSHIERYHRYDFDTKEESIEEIIVETNSFTDGETTAGYFPNGKISDARYRMCKSSGYIRSQTSKYLKGDWDLTGGFSGGPLVEYISGAGYVAIGIHKDGSTIDGSSYPTSYTGALRITQSLYTLFLSYRG